MNTVKHFFLLCLLVLLMSFGIDGQAQNISTMGKDFWVSFIPNSASPTPKTELLVAGQHPCSGVAQNPCTGWSTTFTVTPGSVTSVLIPTSEGVVEKENSVERKAIHITTTEDVSLYASNFVTASYDVANILPTAILMDKYIAQSYYSGSQFNMNSKLLIVAVEDHTEITVDPKGGLRGVFPPYSKKDITLNAGECYLFISANDDISGTSVNVKDGKKVAVFSGGEIAIPSDKCCFDAVFEQCMPMSYWGRHFVVTATALRENDMIRIVSLAPGCRISIDGKHKKTLGARKHFDYKLNSSKKEAVYISASSPIFVCVYLTSSDMGGEMGDPSMVNINPIEQQMDKVTFCTYNTVVSNHHFVNIVTQTSQVKGITLDGESIASEFQPVPSKKELSYARVSVQHGSHTLEAASGGFVAHVYGLGSFESYAYTVGSNSKVLNQFDDEGNLIFSEVPSEIEGLDTVPPGEPVEMEPEPIYVSTDTLPEVKCDTLTLTLLEKGTEIKGEIKDPGNLLEDVNIIDITADPNYPYLLEPIEIEKIGDTIILGIRARNDWCDCFVPNEIEVEIVVIYEVGEDGEQQSRVVIPMTIPVVRENSWLRRCFWVLVTIAALLLFLFYLWALLRKNRFKKSARIDYTFMELLGPLLQETELRKGPKLRDKGFIPWVKRWLVPFRDERRSIPWTVPPAGRITVVAAKSKEKVYITKNSFNPRTMRMENYDPKSDGNKLVEMETIKVYKDNKYQGRLEYNSGSSNDEKYCRIVLGVLMLLSAAAILVLTFLMLRGVL